MSKCRLATWLLRTGGPPRMSRPAQIAIDMEHAKFVGMAYFSDSCAVLDVPIRNADVVGASVNAFSGNDGPLMTPIALK